MYYAAILLILYISCVSVYTCYEILTALGIYGILYDIDENDAYYTDENIFRVRVTRRMQNVFSRTNPYSIIHIITVDNSRSCTNTVYIRLYRYAIRPGTLLTCFNLLLLILCITLFDVIVLVYLLGVLVSSVFHVRLCECPTLYKAIHVFTPACLLYGSITVISFITMLILCIALYRMCGSRVG